MRLAMDIKFPILYKFGSELICADKNYIGLRAVSDDTVLSKETKNNKKIDWFIDESALFRKLKRVGQRRKWALPLGFLWRLSPDEYSVVEERNITVGEVKKLVRVVRDPDDYPLAAALLQALRDRTDDELFTPQMMYTFTSEPLGERQGT